MPDHLPAVVATDLDGTLLREDGTVAPRTLRVLNRVVGAGVRLVLVTGRPPEMVGEVADQVGHNGMAVCSNGAVVLDLQTMTPVAEHPLAPDIARRLWAHIGTEVPDATFGVQFSDHFCCEAAYPPEPWYPFPIEVVDKPQALFDRPMAKLLVREPGVSGDELLARCRIAAAAGGLTHAAEATISGPSGFVEISAAGVSKASSLADLCGQWGVGAERVLAFGDMPNDISVLMWAGRSYAMAGGHRDALAVADHVAPPAREDGVAVVLERVFADLG